MLDHWTLQINEIWGVDAMLTRLDGELDLNLLAQVPDGNDFVCKVMRPGCSASLVEMQCMASEHIRSQNSEIPIPRILKTRSGKPFEQTQDEAGDTRIVWAIEHLPGHSYARHTPKSSDLIFRLGVITAELNQALEGFEHPGLTRKFPWQLMQAQWIESELHEIQDATRRSRLDAICAEFKQLLPNLHALPLKAIHNDLNDYNVLVRASLNRNSRISGIIDFGDMCAAPRICELAIAGAYLVLDHESPESALAQLISGYHSVSPLTSTELELLYPLLRMRLAVSLVVSTKVAKERPDDPYVVISQAPAWRFLETVDLARDLITKRLRVACGLPASDALPRVVQFLDRHRGQFCPILGRDLSTAEMVPLSVNESSFPQDPLTLTAHEAQSMNVVLQDGDAQVGYYREPRLIYSGEQFTNGKWKASDRRTVHIGVDVFAPAGTRISAPLDGTVRFVANQTERLDYGGMVILEHQTPDGDFFSSLYGHLNPDVCAHLQVGQAMQQGDEIGRLGDVSHNGGWAPHLHLQLGIDVDALGADWPGVANPDALAFWTQLFPNPAALLNLDDQSVEYQSISQDQVQQQRQQHFAPNLKLSYQQPVMFLRGYQHYLFDQWGRTYLDAYNNVPHVGHANPRIQAVVCQQLRRMNSNTRYLHPAQTTFARTLLGKMPDEFEVCYFVNSGSEANELALRLARAHSGGKDIITPDHGYHGNTTGAIDISAYKFNAQGGIGQPDWVQLIDAPDVFRGTYRRDDPMAAEKYADQVDTAINRIKQRGGRLAGFIADTFPSVGGQIIPPDGYFQHVYRKIRAAGGLCIADEVQTGLGRLGDYYFAYEQQGVTPDIVVLGKPIGNGHPMGVVITTQAIAESFADGPEFFSTFGGSTLSCVVGNEVLNIVDDEGLQQNAKVTGDYLLDGLRQLQTGHPCIGDVRGLGLFIGLELISDADKLTPATDLASYLVNRLREQRILMGIEGPDNNIVKIRPPLTITTNDVDMILFWLDTILSESAVTAA